MSSDPVEKEGLAADVMENGTSMGEWTEPWGQEKGGINSPWCGSQGLPTHGHF